MQYKYVTEQQNYSDLSSGRVFYSLPGHPAFPVRLASEILQRCLAQREAIYQVTTPGSLYDPCCGAAYHLSVLGVLHGPHIREIIGSDVDEKAVVLAARNLSLLQRDGLDRRIRELGKLVEQYGKESHREALQSAFVLREKLSAFPQPIATRVFQASAADKQAIAAHVGAKSVDIVFTDVPYGRHSRWHEAETDENPLRSMLEALLGVVSDSSIVAIAADKAQKAIHERFQRLEHFQVGKRRIVILRPIWEEDR